MTVLLENGMEHCGNVETTLDFGMTRMGDARIARADVALVLDFVDGGGGAGGRGPSLWYERSMGDAILVGEEDKEAVEAEDNDKGMEEMEITMEDDGKKGVRGGRATTTTRDNDDGGGEDI